MLRSHKIALLTASHLGAIGLAWAVADHSASRSGPASEAPARTKSAGRDSRAAGTGDGVLLLAEFRQEQGVQTPRYQELAETLPPGADMQATVAAAIEEWLKPGTPEESAERRAVLEARVLQWMRRNPGEAMDYLVQAMPSAQETHRVLYLLGENVFPDVAAEQGILEALAWMSKSPASMGALHFAARASIKTGGLSSYVELEERVAEFPQGFWQRQMESDGFLQAVGRLIPMAEKDKLLDYVFQQTSSKKQHNLLLGFAKTGEAATEWLLGLIDRGELDGAFAAGLKSALGNEVLSTPGMEMDARVQARRATKGNETKDRQSIINELVGGDVNRLLVSGRDWRYEFRTGVSSLEEIAGAVREGLPGLPAEGEQAFKVSLYRQLAEENPAKALPLLDGMPEEKRREVLFGTTWQAFTNNDPEIYLRFLNSLPEPATEAERAERIKGWDWKARGCLARYGDDYVEWVRQLPPGLDKERAMNSLVWATREQDPARARELSGTLYPEKP